MKSQTIHRQNKLVTPSEARVCPRKAQHHHLPTKSFQHKLTLNPFKRLNRSPESTRAVSSMSPATTLSAESEPRVVVTTHDEKGAAIFGADTNIPLFRPMGPAGSSFAVFDVRNSVPVNNSEHVQEYPNTIPRCPPNGVIFCITNIAPNFSVPMHRTLSLDYAIVMSGEIVVKLESGAEKTVKAGEFIVQGGVNHSWVNKKDEPCRIGCIMLGAETVKLADGTELGPIAPVPPKRA